MDKYILVILCSAGLLIASCSQKFPATLSDSSGVLVVPIAVSNETEYDFMHQFEFEYSPLTPREIIIIPKRGKQFVICDDFPPGTYQIDTLKYSEIHRPRMYTESSSGSITSDYPLDFEVRPGKITILEYIFEIKQEYLYSQTENMQESFHVFPLVGAQRQNIINALAELENAELWGLDDL